MSRTTHICHYGGHIQRAAVHPSIRARRGLVQSVPPDGLDVPVHGNEHATPAERSARAAGHGQVQLLLRSQVRLGSEDPVRVAVSLRVGLGEKHAGEVKGEDDIGEAEGEKRDFLEAPELPDTVQDLSEASHGRGANLQGAAAAGGWLNRDWQFPNPAESPALLRGWFNFNHVIKRFNQIKRPRWVIRLWPLTPTAVSVLMDLMIFY